MEEKVLKMIEEQVEEGENRIEVQGVYLIKITPLIKQKIESAPRVKALSFQNCRLSSLENFPQIPGLKELDLSDNYLKDENIQELSQFKNLKYMYLSGNKIRNINSLSFLKELENLKEIDVSGCPFAEKDGYNFKLFGMCKNLLLVDGMNIDGAEISQSRSDDTEDNEFSNEGE